MLCICFVTVLVSICMALQTKVNLSLPFPVILKPYVLIYTIP